MTPRSLVSCVGEVSVERRCHHCPSCRRGFSPFDGWSGLTRDTLTPRGRRMAVLAGSRMSFDVASDHLQELCGIRISDQSIRRACHDAGRQAQAHLLQEASSASVREAPGACECSLDGAKVNTTAPGSWLA